MMGVYMVKIRIMTLVLSFCMLQIANGQQRVKFRGSDGWGLTGRYEQYYNKYDIQTVKGRITGVDTIYPFKDMSYGVQIKIKNDTKEYFVDLGPGWYVLFQDVNLLVNNEVEVKGCEIVMEGRKIIMASQVKLTSKSRTLFLRDEDGIPLWCGWRKE